MDLRLVVIPVVLVIVGVIVMVFLNKKGGRSAGVAQNVMMNYVREQLPNMQSANLDVINLLEDTINPEHIWVVAYNDSGMFFIPSTSNPFTRSINRYEDESIDYVPFSAITNKLVAQDKKKIKLHIGDVVKSFKYQNKDCFGANQEQELSKFIKYLSN
ncbi:hypothetical protein GK047_28620 [Paenibacillus sp. SYP-B3998]|uniref:YokE-like PH domain-containing protein n=1 Tax=Paenibacillus sp. SYP-B3998 TaxID=2678564 RepID=A0A6G4A7T8_9BACL|nr:hypothetical protein [Paenibacillus sp. SYP-B3998]NEW09869.1 hypothetical protein [Paenibacillus sp. SYP-B3998]